MASDSELLEIWKALTHIHERLDLMATQADVDALTTAVDQIATDLTAAQSKLQAEINALAAANPGLDLTALQAAVAPVDAAVQALGALAPSPPAPTP
jgi:hypothetical protein